MTRENCVTFGTKSEIEGFMERNGYRIIHSEMNGRWCIGIRDIAVGASGGSVRLSLDVGPFKSTVMTDDLRLRIQADTLREAMRMACGELRRRLSLSPELESERNRNRDGAVLEELERLTETGEC